MAKGNGGVQVPQDLSSLSDDELQRLHDDVHAEATGLVEDENLDAVGLARATELADEVDRIEAEQDQRAEAAAQQEAEREALKARLSPPAADEEPADTEAEGADAEAEPEPALAAAGRKKTDVRDVLKSRRSNLNAKLSQVQQYDANGLPRPTGLRNAEPVLVASADIRGFTQGAQIPDWKALVAAIQARARTAPLTHLGPNGANYVPVAQLQRQFTHTLDITSPPEETWPVLQAAMNPEALVAAGGWCSPSEISYDFYNIVCEDGMADLPTTGIRRGGMRWPTSPSFGDLASSTGLWIWNETQDVAAATGTGMSGTKTCARVPCAGFNEARLDCDGVCITAGNLTTDAWPEQIANFMRLVSAAHAHRMNNRLIAKMASASVAVTGIGVTGQGVAVPILDTIEMQAIDYRTKYAMCDDALLEGMFPNWVFAMVRADLAKRKGYSSPGASFNITNAEIGAWFTSRGIRAQFVQDWQVRATGFPGNATPMTAWPSTLQFLMYAAGTFVKGNGLQLDLGVVRDSVLNATNDYTAAWYEDCWLLAQVGHESRLVTVSLCANGAVGGDITYACPAL
jgi:hypothetical protein